MGSVSRKPVSHSQNQNIFVQNYNLYPVKIGYKGNQSSETENRPHS